MERRVPLGACSPTETENHAGDSPIAATSICPNSCLFVTGWRRHIDSKTIISLECAMRRLGLIKQKGADPETALLNDLAERKIFLHPIADAGRRAYGVVSQLSAGFLFFSKNGTARCLRRGDAATLRKLLNIRDNALIWQRVVLWVTVPWAFILIPTMVENHHDWGVFVLGGMILSSFLTSSLLAEALVKVRWIRLLNQCPLESSEIQDIRHMEAAEAAEFENIQHVERREIRTRMSEVGKDAAVKIIALIVSLILCLVGLLNFKQLEISNRVVEFVLHPFVK